MARSLWCVVCILLLSVCVEAKEYPAIQAVLFDFEAGVEGWSGNPWKGGTCPFEATTDARFGKQALHGWYEGTPKKDGGNIISPYLPDDASWRKGEWGVISLWLKGDGSAGSIRLILEDGAKEHATFSKDIPLDGKEWRSFSFPLRSFWNRGKRKIDATRLKRLYFGGTPDQSFVVDRIALETPHREIPLEEAQGNTALPVESVSVLEQFPGRYDVRLVPPLKPVESSLDVAVVLAVNDGAKTEEKFNLPLSPGSDEVYIPLSIPLPRDAVLSLDVSAKGASGKEYSARFQFPVFVRAPIIREPFLSICPLPKEMKPGDGVFRLSPSTRIIPASTTDEMKYCVDLLRAELKKWYNLSLESQPDGEKDNAIVLTLEDVGLPAEGYVLRATPKTVEISARDCRALYYGVQTLLQAVAESSECPASPQVKCVEIRDWPSLPMRSARIGLPVDKWGYPNDPEAKVEDFIDFLYSTMGRYKYNTLILEMGQGCRFACAPKIGAKHAWDRADLEKIRDFCKRHFIEIIPCVNSMGHTGWLLLGYPELRWHGGMNMLCTCNPKSYEILTSVYDELIDIFHPRIFHIGMDEVRWQGNPKEPKPPRCGCDDVPTWEQYGNWVKKLHAHLTQRGLRTMMWGDMPLPAHNGGPPFFTQRALPQIPRDILIANWSLGVDPLSNFFFNKECGFPDVIQSNSSGVDVDQTPYIKGNMFGMWSKAPWLSQRDEPGSQTYCYLGLVQAGEFSWNVNRSQADVAKQYDPEYLQLREASVLRDLAMLPEPHAGKAMAPIDLSSAANCRLTDLQAGAVNVSGIDFALLPEGKCVELRTGDSRTIPFAGNAASLHFLHAEQLPDNQEQRKSFDDRWKDPANLWGIPVARYEIVYEDNSVEPLTVKHSWNILPRRMLRTLPYAYRVVGSYRLPGDSPEESNALYAAQWVNPHPEKKIKEVRMIGGETESVVFVFAITGRQASLE